MGPTLLLLVLRDTIYSFQTSFVPALVITDGGPPRVRHDVPAAVHLPQRLRVPPLRLRRRGHGRDAGRDRRPDRRAVRRPAPLAPRPRGLNRPVASPPCPHRCSVGSGSPSSPCSTTPGRSTPPRRPSLAAELVDPASPPWSSPARPVRRRRSIRASGSALTTAVRAAVPATVPVDHRDGSAVGPPGRPPHRGGGRRRGGRRARAVAAGSADLEGYYSAGRRRRRRTSGARVPLPGDVGTGHRRRRAPRPRPSSGWSALKDSSGDAPRMVRTLDAVRRRPLRRVGRGCCRRPGRSA